MVEHAYAAGASWVEVEWPDGPIQRSRLTHASMQTLTKSRPWAIERTRAAGRGVFMQLVGDSDPHLLDDFDPGKAPPSRWKRCWPAGRRAWCGVRSRALLRSHRLFQIRQRLNVNDPERA